MKMFRVMGKLSVAPNCYVMVGEKSALVIDPVIKYNVITEHADKPVTMVLITHGHYDHFYELASYLEQGVKVYLHPEAAKKLADPKTSASRDFCENLKFELTKSQAKFVKQGDVIKFETHKILAHEFGGHTDCGLVFELNQNLFVGDLVFAGGYVGRTDLPTSNPEEMQKSLERFENDFNGYTVYSGHGDEFVH